MLCLSLFLSLLCSVNIALSAVPWSRLVAELSRKSSYLVVNGLFQMFACYCSHGPVGTLCVPQLIKKAFFPNIISFPLDHLHLFFVQPKGKMLSHMFIYTNRLLILLTSLDTNFHLYSFGMKGRIRRKKMRERRKLKIKHVWEAITSVGYRLATHISCKYTGSYLLCWLKVQIDDWIHALHYFSLL